MKNSIANIFTGLPDELPDELFQTLLQNNTVHIERILSKGHSTPINHWYDQSWDEWVLLLQGQASLLYEHNADPFTLNPGDYCLIPAHTRHRVVWTAPDQATIWLAIHLNKALATT